MFKNGASLGQSLRRGDLLFTRYIRPCRTRNKKEEFFRVKESLFSPMPNLQLPLIDVNTLIGLIFKSCINSILNNC